MSPPSVLIPWEPESSEVFLCRNGKSSSSLFSLQTSNAECRGDEESVGTTHSSVTAKTRNISEKMTRRPFPTLQAWFDYTNMIPHMIEHFAEDRDLLSRTVYRFVQESEILYENPTVLHEAFNALLAAAAGATAAAETVTEAPDSAHGLLGQPHSAAAAPHERGFDGSSLSSASANRDLAADSSAHRLENMGLVAGIGSAASGSSGDGLILHGINVGENAGAAGNSIDGGLLDNGSVDTFSITLSQNMLHEDPTSSFEPDVNFFELVPSPVSSVHNLKPIQISDRAHAVVVDDSTQASSTGPGPGPGTATNDTDDDDDDRKRPAKVQKK